MKWLKKKAAEWYAETEWIAGFNYVPSTAVNSTEMWQSETYDRETIDRELKLAAEAGYNACRVFLQYLVWENERERFINNFNDFLHIADQNIITVMPVLFDDCAFAGREPYLGAQDGPKPGVHNSGWTPSPGAAIADDPAMEASLSKYVKEIIGAFKDDRRIIVWDLYNEPGNNNRGPKCLPLVEKAFLWAREAGPSQPLTVGVWEFKEYDLSFAEMSDVVSFHDYSKYEESEAKIAALKQYGRPLICTEWLHRINGNNFANHLPLYRHHGVGVYNWGLVTGKTQTNLSWDTMRGQPDSEPDIWQQDIFYPGGTPYREDEVKLLREFRNAGRGIINM